MYNKFLSTKIFIVTLITFLSFSSLTYGASSTTDNKSNSNISAQDSATDDNTIKKLQKLGDDDIIINNGWARPSLSSTNSNSAVYLTLQNKTTNDLVLIGASAIDIANSTELHQTVVNDQGIAHMVHIDKLNVPKGSTVTFKPGGIHIMLMRLKKILNVGDKFELNLSFEGYEPKTFSINVQEQSN